MPHPDYEIGYQNAATAPYTYNGFTFPNALALKQELKIKKNSKGAISGGGFLAFTADAGGWTYRTGTGVTIGGPTWSSESRQSALLYSENNNPLCIIPYRVNTKRNNDTSKWNNPSLTGKYEESTYNYLFLTAAASSAAYQTRIKYDTADDQPSRTYYYAASNVQRRGNVKVTPVGQGWPDIYSQSQLEPRQQYASHPYIDPTKVKSSINNTNTSFMRNNSDDWDAQFVDYANVGEIMQEILSINDEFGNSKINEQYLQYFSQFGCLPHWYEFIHLQTTIPIFQHPRDAINYLITGSIEGAANESFITLSDLDWSTDWTLYIKGKSPSIKLVWESKKLEEWINNEKQNTLGITLDDILVEVSHNTPNGEIELLKYFPYSTGYYTTSYEILAQEQDPDAFDKFLAEIIGSVTGIGDVYIFFRVYYTKMWSKRCYCAIPYSVKPTQYGQWGNDPTRPDDNSTVTIVYGSDGAEDDGYLDRVDPSDKDIIGDDIEAGEGTQGSSTGAGTSGLVNRTYAMSITQMKQIASFLWSDNFFDNIKLVNNSPIENIVACKMFPTSLSGETEEISLGNVATGVEGGKRSDSKRITIGTCEIPTMYNNFLDYSPYTKATIFLPFIGFKEMDLNLVMGKTIKVDYVFDLITGAVKAMLFADNIYIQSFDGNAGLDIPITASNRAQIEAGYITGAMGVVTEFASGDIMGAAQKGLATAMSQYHYYTQGSYSPNCAWYETRKCYIILDRPTAQIPSTYAHNVGYPCELSYRLGNLSGFTVTESGIDLSGIPCTDDEREEILSLLTTGIYL